MKGNVFGAMLTFVIISIIMGILLPPLETLDEATNNLLAIALIVGTIFGYKYLDEEKIFDKFEGKSKKKRR